MGGRVFQSIPKVQLQFLRTIHLEVMPDSNAELDGITMRVSYPSAKPVFS
jgi:hypothetical protein